ncbi:cupin domain-containing protein, partial [Salmonella enterica subsp. enterica serovar Typhimurium]|uniref:cupin domain-containing protein n=2 Tax=Pseudomonadota TaxID=1224 RepID=UPI0020A238F3
LPPLIVLPLVRVPGLDLALELLFSETDRVRCGQRLLADRLFEVVVLQLLRWLLDHPQEAGVRPGLIIGLSDPRLARALVAMHDSP